VNVTRQAGALLFRADRTHAGQACVQVVSELLHLSTKESSAAFRQGQIRIGQRTALASDELRAGEVVRAQLAPGPSEPFAAIGGEPAPYPLDITVLYEDDHVLIADKPAGLIMYPGDANEPRTLASAVAHYYLQTGQDAYVRAVHRLDRDTTGVCLYAKHLPALRLLSTALEQRKVRRYYLALVDGEPSKRAGVIDKPLGRDRHVAGRMRVNPGGQTAVTRYHTLWQGQRYTLLRCELETGRTHQIRVHLASIGLPLVGDRLYGTPSPLLLRQALHAAKLSCPEPYGTGTIEVEAPLPDDLSSVLRELGCSTINDL